MDEVERYIRDAKRLSERGRSERKKGTTSLCDKCYKMLSCPLGEAKDEWREKGIKIVAAECTDFSSQYHVLVNYPSLKGWACP